MGYSQIYYDTSAVFIRFDTRLSVDVIQMTVAPALASKSAIGASTDCARLTNEGGYHCFYWGYINLASATSFCEAAGMKLIAIETEDEENAVRKKWIDDCAHIGKCFWTSGSDAAKKGTYIWTSTGQPATYTDWRTGQPNGLTGYDYIAFNSYNATFSNWASSFAANPCYPFCEAMPY